MDERFSARPVPLDFAKPFKLGRVDKVALVIGAAGSAGLMVLAASEDGNVPGTAEAIFFYCCIVAGFWAVTKGLLWAIR